jgi:hypothetical protein
MKKLYSLLAGIALLPAIANAQILVGSNKAATMNVAGKLSSNDLAKLKETTTLFLLQDADYRNVAEWEAAIKSVWTYTPFKVITRDELGNYRDGNYSYFAFGGYAYQSATSSPLKFKNQTVNAIHLTYDLILPKEKGEDYFARLELYPDNSTMFDAASTHLNKKQGARIGGELYTTTKLHNWSPFILKCFLKTVNERLLTGAHRGTYTEETNTEALTALKTDTLYIPDYVNIKFNLMTTKDKVEETDMKELRSSYPYPVRVLPKEELAQIIATANKPVYCLIYTKATTDKFLNVFNAKTGQMLYARYDALSHNFKYKDLKELEKAIK